MTKSYFLKDNIMDLTEWNNMCDTLYALFLDKKDNDVKR